MNESSRYGSRAGNCFGVLALMYSSFDWTVDEVIFPQLGVDRAVDTRIATPVLAAALTGALYKSTSELHANDLQSPLRSVTY